MSARPFRIETVAGSDLSEKRPRMPEPIDATLRVNGGQGAVAPARPVAVWHGAVGTCQYCAGAAGDCDCAPVKLPPVNRDARSGRAIRNGLSRAQRLERMAALERGRENERERGEAEARNAELADMAARAIERELPPVGAVPLSDQSRELLARGMTPGPTLSDRGRGSSAVGKLIETTTPVPNLPNPEKAGKPGHDRFGRVLVTETRLRNGAWSSADTVTVTYAPATIPMRSHTVRQDLGTFTRSRNSMRAARPATPARPEV